MAWARGPRCSEKEEEDDDEVDGVCAKAAGIRRTKIVMEAKANERIALDVLLKYKAG